MIGRLYCAGFGCAAGVIIATGQVFTGVGVLVATVILAYIWGEV